MLVHTSEIASTSARRIALLDHLQQPPVAVLRRRPDHASVARRVFEHRRDGGCRVPAGEVGGDQLLQRVGAQQRCVAGKHDDRRVVIEVIAGNGGHTDHCRVAGAALHALLDERDVRPRRRLLLHLLGHPLCAMPDDHDGAVDVDADRAWITCITIGRPQIRWSGFGRVERIREPSPAASTIAETVMCPFYRTGAPIAGEVHCVPGRGFEPL